MKPTINRKLVEELFKEDINWDETSWGKDQIVRHSSYENIEVEEKIKSTLQDPKVKKLLGEILSGEIYETLGYGNHGLSPEHKDFLDKQEDNFWNNLLKNCK
jgi:hypothetical protein